MNTIDRVWEHSVKNPIGFTVDPVTFETPTGGYGVSLKESQDLFGKSGLAKAVEIALERKCFVGGWFNYKNGKTYFDATVVLDDIEEAMRLAKENEQLAIFDFNNLETIYII